MNGRTAAGTLDPAFGDAGMVLLNLSHSEQIPSSFDYFSDIAIQPTDKKLVVVGSRSAGRQNGVWLLARFNPDGSLDPSFADGGLASADFATNNVDQARAVALQPDGKIVVAGTAGGVRFPSDGDYRFAVARFTSDGRLDQTFGEGGQAQVNLTEIDDQVTDVALQPDGKILEAGYTTPHAGGINEQFTVVRWTVDGTLDPTFGSAGVATINITGVRDEAAAIAVDVSGRIVLAGIAGTAVGLARLQPDGTPDPTFGSNGAVQMDPGSRYSFASDVVIQPDGKIVVAGATDVGENRVFLVARFSDGVLDSTFNGSGLARMDFPSEHDLTDDTARGIALQPDGGIIVVGTAADDKFIAVARVNADGQLDSAFGQDGMTTVKTFVDVPVDQWGASRVAVQADGQIVIAGWAPGGNWQPTVLRLIGG